jgi:transcriptional regulator with XRE-family HTH domain
MFYDRYCILCDELKMSPSSVAIQNNISKTSVTRWKNGATPNLNIIKKIAVFFQVPTSFLLEEKPFTNWNQMQKFLPAIIFAIKNEFHGDPFEKFGISDDGKPINKLIIFLSSCVDYIDIDEKTNALHINYFVIDKETQKKEPATERDKLAEETNELFSKLPLDKKKQALEYLRFLVEHQGKQ